jgi:hypothetical protein
MTLALIFSAASLLICGFSFIYFQAYLHRRTGAKRILAEFEEEANKIIATIDAAADRDITLVEERIKSLKAVLDTADRRIAACARELDSRAAQEAAYAALGASAGRQTPRASKADTATFRADSLSGAGMDSASAAPSGGTIALPLGPRFVHSPSPIKPKPRPLTERVSELSRNGLSPEAIAARLGVTISEVDLALAVGERRQSSSVD